MRTQNVNNLVEKGALPSNNPRELAVNCDFIFLSLPSHEATKEVIFGNEGLINGLKPGSVVIETSTIPPSTIVEIGKKLAKIGVEVLDAPVSGGRFRAEKGELTIIVGGKYRIYQKSHHLLKIIGNKIYYVGKLGSGETVKLLNSTLALIALLVGVEVCRTALKLEIKQKTLHKIIKNSTGDSWMWENWIPKILKKQKVNSKVKIALKDLLYAKELLLSVNSDTSFVDVALSKMKKIFTDESSDLSEIFYNFIFYE